MGPWGAQDSWRAWQPCTMQPWWGFSKGWIGQLRAITGTLEVQLVQSFAQTKANSKVRFFWLSKLMTVFKDSSISLSTGLTRKQITHHFFLYSSIILFLLSNFYFQARKRQVWETATVLWLPLQEKIRSHWAFWLPLGRSQWSTTRFYEEQDSYVVLPYNSHFSSCKISATVWPHNSPRSSWQKRPLFQDVQRHLTFIH